MQPFWFLPFLPAVAQEKPDAQWLKVLFTNIATLYYFLKNMNWIALQDEKQLDEIVANSNTIPQVIFKHSTRCSVSSMAKYRLDKKEAPPGVSFYLLDLIKYRNISNKIAFDFGISHESPQVLVINNGECVYDESHSGIMFDEIEAVALQR